MKRVKPVHNSTVIVRVYPEERDILRFNTELHGMSMSDYIRLTCLGIRLRRTPEEKRRLCKLARIGTDTNPLVIWVNGTFLESVNASVSQTPCKNALFTLS